MDNCLFGSTYVSLEDALLLQHQVGEDKSIKIIISDAGSDNERAVHVKRSWVKSIIHCHTRDSYGARFPVIPQFKSGNTDTRTLWILSGMIALVKELWEKQINVKWLSRNGMVGFLPS